MTIKMNTEGMFMTCLPGKSRQLFRGNRAEEGGETVGKSCF